MGLTLRIENETKLPDGGPISITVSGRRSIDIGRDSHLDWTLPDPTRHVSSKHCEVRYKDGGYWLHDVSTNGTFLNGNDHRMQAPHRLSSGDRFIIGHYIIAATVDGEAVAVTADTAPAASQPAVNYRELWANDGNVAPPIDRAALKPPRERHHAKPDFLDWAADVPDAAGAPDPGNSPLPPPSVQPNPSIRSAGSPFVQHDSDSWASGPRTPQPPGPPPPPAMPIPRRPPPIASQPDEPWGGELAKPAVVAEPSRRASSDPALSNSATISPNIAQRVAQGARVPPDYFAARDTEELAEMMGQVIRLVVEGTMQLLNARLQAKRLSRSSSHTMIEAIHNNPLKFSPSAEDALRIMFGPPTRSYLDAYSAFAQGFDDLKSHEMKTYAAMQHALMALMKNLDPETIDRENAAEGGIGALVGSRKGRLWDAYVARWQAKMGRENKGLIDAFMLEFAKFYDREG